MRVQKTLIQTLAYLTLALRKLSWYKLSILNSHQLSCNPCFIEKTLNKLSLLNSYQLSSSLFPNNANFSSWQGKFPTPVLFTRSVFSIVSRYFLVSKALEAKAPNPLRICLGLHLADAWIPRAWTMRANVCVDLLLTCQRLLHRWLRAGFLCRALKQIQLFTQKLCTFCGAK